MGLQNDLNELQEAGVINSETADNIRAWYDRDRDSSPGRMLILFGILGGLLVGMGVILVVAHNWDQFSRPVRTFFAFLPMAVGQLACVVARLRWNTRVWRESTSAFLFFSVGAAIAIVSQIYHIDGDMQDFLFAWTALCIPLIYLMESSATSLLSLCLMTFYIMTSSYGQNYYEGPAYPYVVFFLAVVPHYYQLVRKSPESNFTRFHHWFVPLSLVVALPNFLFSVPFLGTPGYLSLFGIYLMIALAINSEARLFQQSYMLLGSAGTVSMLLMASFNDFWKGWPDADLYQGPSLIISTILGLLYVALLVATVRRNKMVLYEPLHLSFIVFTVIMVISRFADVGFWLVNGFILLVGLSIIVRGSRVSSLGLMNYGMIIISILILCRFFDSDLSFILRGILFIVTGGGFFLLNYFAIKKRKANE